MHRERSRFCFRSSLCSGPLKVRTEENVDRRGRALLEIQHQPSQATGKTRGFRLVLRNKYRVLHELIDQEPVVESWKAVRVTMTTDLPGSSGPQDNHKEWISVEPLKKTQMRKVRKAALNNSRTRTDKARAQQAYS